MAKKGIVEAHGGEIGVESSPRNGATFHFTLPLVDDLDRAIERWENEGGHPQGRKESGAVSAS